MRIFKITMDYLYASNEEDKAKLWAERHAIVTSLGIEVPVGFDKSSYSSFDMVVTGEQLINLSLKGVVYKVVQEVNLGSEPSQALVNIQKVANKLEVLLASSSIENLFNNKVEVHMPGAALSTYNHIMLMEDACSNGLQDELNSGWRIIACCPQNDQRRPDYILGRFDPDLDTKHINGAARPTNVKKWYPCFCGASQFAASGHSCGNLICSPAPTAQGEVTWGISEVAAPPTGTVVPADAETWYPCPCGHTQVSSPGLSCGEDGCITQEITPEHSTKCFCGRTTKPGVVQAFDCPHPDCIPF